MASSTLQKLLRSQSQSAAKILAHFHKPSPLLLTQIPKISEPIDSGNFKSESSRANPNGFSHAYPTFSFAYLLNPISPPPLLIRTELEEDTTPDDSRTIRADSVKKKRKKKMNKHKLRKLRKRLRRKTKT